MIAEALKDLSFQGAIGHGPGRCASVLLFDRAPGVLDATVRRAAASLMVSAIDAVLPSSVHVLVALGTRPLQGFTPPGGLVSEADLQTAAALLGDAGFEQESHDLLVQIAADTELDRTLALRLVDACLGEALGPAVAEHHGSRLLNGIENFGFRDGAAPSASQLEEVLREGAVGPNGGSVGLWALFQPFGQNVRKFFAQTEEERARIVGRAPVLVPDTSEGRRASLEVAATERPTSHWAQMRNAPANILRRGFPCRSGSEPTLAFVALAARLEHFEKALGLFKNDALHAFVKDRGGALYFCPPDAGWLEAGVPAIRPGELSAYGRQTPMVAYDMVASFETYLMALRDAGVFAGSIGSQKIDAGVRAELDEVHRLLDPSGRFELDQKLSKVEADANTVNGIAGTYVTAS